MTGTTAADLSGKKTSSNNVSALCDPQRDKLAGVAEGNVTNVQELRRPAKISNIGLRN
jgi:hypothetical protein